MSEPTVCPMQFSASVDDAGTLSERVCLEGKCAWWMPEMSRGRDKVAYPAGCAITYDARLVRRGFGR